MISTSERKRIVEFQIKRRFPKMTKKKIRKLTKIVIKQMNNSASKQGA